MIDQNWIKDTIYTIWFSYGRYQETQNVPKEGLFYATLYILYVYHKRYPVAEGCIAGDHPEDPLLSELRTKSAATTADYPKYLVEQYQRIEAAAQQGDDLFDNNYPYLLIGLFEAYRQTVGPTHDTGALPAELNQLIATLVRQEGCTSVYDPFCGTATIAQALNTYGYTCRFAGTDLSPETALFARMMVESVGGNPTDVACADSWTGGWNPNPFDAIVTCPPIDISDTENSCYITFAQLEEIILHRAARNHARMVLILVPEFIDNLPCLTGELQLDTYIELPSGLIPGMRNKGAIHIYKQNRPAGAPVRILLLGSIYQNEGDEQPYHKVFDLHQYYSLDLKQNNDYCTYIPKSELKGYYYSLFPKQDLTTLPKVDTGQKKVKMADLFVEPDALPPAHEKCENLVFRRYLSYDIYQVLLNQNRYSPTINFMIHKGPTYVQRGKYLLEQYDARIYGLHTAEDEHFMVQAGISVFRINERLVLPEYVLYLLMRQYRDAISQFPSIRYCMTMPVIIDNFDHQRRIVNEFKKVSQSQLEGTLKSLGVRQEANHTKSLTRHRIEQLLYRLEQLQPGAADYAPTLRALRDNIEYIERLEEYSRATTLRCYLPEWPEDFIRYIRTYAERWGNYGYQCFELTIDNRFQEEAPVRYDATLMTVLLDAILDNAVRHGFNRERKSGNRVEITLSKVQHEERPYLLLQVSNNGAPLPEGFTLQNYVTCGRYSSDAVSSGMGGYHVHQVTQGHHGYLYIDHNDQWNLIVEILLPLDTEQTNTLNTYEHGESCI